MKLFIFSLSLLVGMAAHADRCNKQAIAHYSTTVAQQGHYLEGLVENAIGYEHLDIDCHDLHLAAEQMSHGATAGVTCQQLDGQYHHLAAKFQSLARLHDHAQLTHPNHQIRYAFSNLSRAVQQLDHAVHTPATLTLNLTCQSHNYQYQSCPVNGNIVRAHVAQQLSTLGCVQGRSWGFAQNYIWVNRGCRANFSVTVQPY